MNRARIGKDMARKDGKIGKNRHEWYRAGQEKGRAR